MLNTLIAEWQIIFERDPAAHSWFEVLFVYLGLQVLVCYRVAHWLYNFRVPLIPRLISHLACFLTGIESHPKARIGKGVFIDHGIKIVVGETAIVGDYGLIYQGITLGGTGKETGSHPKLEENLVVGAGTKVLGNIQTGDHIRIGAGSVVLRNIPADCTVVGIPGRIVYRQGEPVGSPNQQHLQVPKAEVIRALFDRIQFLEQKIERVRTQT